MSSDVTVVRPGVPTWGQGARLDRLFRTVWQQRTLLWQMTQRELRSRYLGSTLGWLWSIVTPAGMVAVYTWVFGYVLRAPWPAGERSPIMVAAHLLCGLSVFHAFAEVLTRAPVLLLSHPNLVRKTLFPLEVLVVAAITASAVQVLAGWTIVAAVAGVCGRLTTYTLWLPLVWLLLCLQALGLGLFLVTLGTFVRDLVPATGIVAQVLLFLSPIFYPLAVVPEPWRHLAWLNPLAGPVESARAALLCGQPPALASWAASVAWAGGLLLAGHMVFTRQRRSFADVL